MKKKNCCVYLQIDKSLKTNPVRWDLKTVLFVPQTRRLLWLRRVWKQCWETRRSRYIRRTRGINICTGNTSCTPSAAEPCPSSPTTSLTWTSELVRIAKTFSIDRMKRFCHFSTFEQGDQQVIFFLFRCCENHSSSRSEWLRVREKKQPAFSHNHRRQWQHHWRLWSIQCEWLVLMKI